VSRSTPPDPARAALEGLADADILGRFLPEAERGRTLDAVFAELAAGAEAMALRYGEVLGGAPDGDHLVVALEEHLRRFAPRASPAGAVAARERLFYLAVAACDDDPDLARRLRDLAAATARAFEPVVAQYLSVTGRRPRPGSSLAELPLLVGGLLEGLVLRMRADPAGLDRAALSVLRALEGWTEPAAQRDGDEDAGPIEARVRRLDRRLAVLDATSPAALELALELLGHVPRSAFAFWRARQRLGPLLADDRLGTTELGRRVQLAGAEVLAMADGDRATVEAALALRRRVATQDAMGELRHAWLLLRLERFADADEQLRTVAARGDLGPEARTLLDAFTAYARALTGPRDAALSAARAASDGTGFGAAFGRGVAIRLLARAGALDEAAALAEAGPDPRPGDVGSTMLLIAHCTLDVARGRPTRALDGLIAARDALRLVGNRNPSGWPWLEPMAAALVRLGRRQDALALVQGARTDAVRWARRSCSPSCTARTRWCSSARRPTRRGPPPRACSARPRRRSSGS
jgi:hypothetical protein